MPLLKKEHTAPNINRQNNETGSIINLKSLQKVLNRKNQRASQTNNFDSSGSKATSTFDISLNLNKKPVLKHSNTGLNHSNTPSEKFHKKQ